MLTLLPPGKISADAHETRHVSSNFLPCQFLVSVKPTTDFNRLPIPGDKTKKLRGVMAAYLLYRYKHLCMLIFRVVSPSLTKKVCILHIAGNNNKFDNMISVM